MSAFDKFPLGKPAFVTHVLDRAAHLRTNDEKLFALEGQRNAGAYVIYRDSLLVKQEADGPRALLGVEEAVKLGANPGTIFLGLRDGAPVFGMGISADRGGEADHAATTSPSPSCAAWRCRARCRRNSSPRSRWRNRW